MSPKETTDHANCAHRMPNATPVSAPCGKCQPSPKQKRIKAKRCPICFETVLAAHPSDSVAENSLGCQNGHLLCMACVKKLIEPTRLCSPTCGGFAYRCPFCRSRACLRPTHVLAVLKGGHAAAQELIDARFNGDNVEFDTQRICGMHPPSDDESEEEDQEVADEEGDQAGEALADVGLD